MDFQKLLWGSEPLCVFAPAILSNIALKKSYADVFYRQKPAYEAGFLLYGTFADGL